jgi:hypothetical protein
MPPVLKTKERVAASQTQGPHAFFAFCRQGRQGETMTLKKKIEGSCF